jgi:ABC-type microcin C transport system permease subunit YejE
MAIGTTLITVVVLVVAIWIFIEMKRFKHKIFAILLILLILFTYMSFAATIKGKDLDFKSIDGIKEAGQLYFSWLGSIFGNLKSLTSNAISMNWSVNKTPENQNEE